MFRRGGPARVSAARSVLYGLSLVLNIGVSVILARRLVAEDYAAYQFATKRIIQYVTVPVSFFGLWSYRYLVARKRGAMGALLILLAVSALISIPLGFYLELYESRVGYGPAALASVVLITMNIYFTVTSALDALRPLRRALLSVTYRLLYFSAIFGTLYLMEPSLQHAFLGTILATLAGAAVGAYWLGDVVDRGYFEEGYRTLKEWARTSKPLLISFVVGFLASLDAALAYPIAGDRVVAAFFVVAAVATLVREAANNGLSYLHQYVLRTGDVAGAARAVYVVTAAAVPFFVYAAVNPVYVIYVFNPVYKWAATAMRAFMAIAIVEVVNAGLTNMAYGSVRDVGPESVPAFTRISVLTSLPSAIYLGALVSAMYAFRPYGAWGMLIGWAVAYGLRFALSAVLAYFKLVPEEGRAALRGRALRLIVEIALSAALAVLIAPWSPPKKGLLASIEVLGVPGAVYLAAYFGVLIALDREIRSSIASLIKGISSWAG